MRGRRDAIALLTAAFLLPATASCAATKPDGRRELERKIRSQSQGLIQLASYRKLNGFDRGAAYIVQYEATISFTEDCWWIGVPGFVNTGDYTAWREKQPRVLHFLSDDQIRARKGELHKLSGHLIYQTSDNGWIVVG